MDRTEARAAAMKLIYEWQMGGDGGEETRMGLLEIRPNEKEADFMDELARTYASPQSVAFVNGILGSVQRALNA